MASDSQKDLAVIIVSWNVKDAVLENLRSVFASRPMPALDVILVDNASDDGTVEAVREAFPDVGVIANRENRGFAAACNQGIREALSPPLTPPPGGGDGEVGAPHILLLNPDMRVEPDALAKTVDSLDTYPNVAVLGAKLVGRDGQSMHHLRRFPTWKDQLVVTLKLKRLFPKTMDRYMGNDLDLEREQDVDTVRGSYFAINRSALETVGLLDERYFIWFEEVDYCRRVKEKGMSVRYVPSIVAHDLVGKSFAQRGRWWKRKQFLTSMVSYFWKWL
ncbi:MAG: glycosyltransferase family 2 protein [Patescibacteria group bacterium]